MHEAALHLVRRGLEAHQNAEYQLPVWGVVLLCFTVLFFIVANIHIEYTFGRLVPTLVMVESTEPVVVDSPDAEPLLDEKTPLDKDSKDVEAEPVVLLVKEKPITSGLCSTIRHLRQQAGRFARYRGIGAFGAYALANGFIMKFLRMSMIVPRGVAPIISAMICANLATTWTHVAISMPSEKHWIKRIPGFQAWKKVAGPTFFFALAKHMTCMAPMALARFWGLGPHMDHNTVNAMSDDERLGLFFQIIALGALGLLMAILFLLPAKVVLTRVQASLLKEEEQSIVPFDRTFGGRVVPKALGGDGLVAARDAWRSFAEESRLNLFKVYGQVMLMEVVLFLSFAITICAELVLIMGDDIKQFIPADHQKWIGGQ